MRHDQLGVRRLGRRRVLGLAGFAAAGVGVGGVLSGCTGGDGGTSTASTSLTFSSYTFSDFQKAMTQVLDAWKTEHPGVTLQSQFAPATDYWTKIQTQVAGGTAPDLSIGENDLVVSYAKDGLIMNLKDLIKDKGYDTSVFAPGTAGQYTWKDGDFNVGGEGGDLYGLPSDAQGFIFAYNKTLFDKAKVAYPTDDWTWDDVTAAAKELTDASTKTYGVLAPSPDAMYRGNFVYSAGGSMANADTTASALNTPESLQAYQWAWDLIWKHKVAPRPAAGTAATVDLFGTGRAAMTFDGIWQVAAWNAVKNFSWDIAMLPKHPTTGKRTTSVESDGWWIYGKTKNLDLAWDMITFLSSEKIQKTLSGLNYVVPPSRTSVSQEWYAQDKPKSLALALKNVQTDGRPRDGLFYGFGRVAAAIGPILQKAYAGGQDLPTQLTAAAAAMDDALKKARRDF